MRASGGRGRGEWSLEGDDKKFQCTRNVGWGGDSEDGYKEEFWATGWSFLLAFEILGENFFCRSNM